MEEFLSIVTSVPVVLPIALLLVAPLAILIIALLTPIARHEEKKHPEVPHGIHTPPRGMTT